jgi:Leucine-rich repeat (LRR) protein
MGCAASKAPPKRDPVEELIEDLPLAELPEFGTHPALTAIECNNCSLERLPPSKALRAALPALEYLTVHQNRIAELPALDLPEFTTLNAGGNPREAAWKS